MSIADGTYGNARLGPEDGTGYVEFDFNPAAISIAHMAPMRPTAGRRSNKPGGSGGGSAPAASLFTTPDQVAEANGMTRITIRQVTLVGQDVRNRCLTLIGWSHLIDLKQSTKKQDLPKLKFIWGPQIYLVNLNQVTVNYTRFDRTGLPVRADVDLTLHSIPKIPGPTNPSSGGLAGRRTHLLTGAETLPELATRTYGGPNRWREIATANGIEDPLRVRPGTVVYLPSELEDGQ
jgi:nucleoid-associated protein YgaU